MKGMLSFLKTVAAWAITATVAGMMTVAITVFVLKSEVDIFQKALTRIERKLDSHLLQHTRMAEGMSFIPILTKGAPAPWLENKNPSSIPAKRATN